jgi:hypothetical protein
MIQRCFGAYSEVNVTRGDLAVGVVAAGGLPGRRSATRPGEFSRATHPDGIDGHWSDGQSARRGGPDAPPYAAHRHGSRRTGRPAARTGRGPGRTPARPAPESWTPGWPRPASCTTRARTAACSPPCRASSQTDTQPPPSAGNSTRPASPPSTASPQPYSANSAPTSRPDSPRTEPAPGPRSPAHRSHRQPQYGGWRSCYATRTAARRPNASCRQRPPA